jgi:hypothetical protein
MDVQYWGLSHQKRPKTSVPLPPSIVHPCYNFYSVLDAARPSSHPNLVNFYPQKKKKKLAILAMEVAFKSMAPFGIKVILKYSVNTSVLKILKYQILYKVFEILWF